MTTLSDELVILPNGMASLPYRPPAQSPAEKATSFQRAYYDALAEQAHPLVKGDGVVEPIATDDLLAIINRIRGACGLAALTKLWCGWPNSSGYNPIIESLGHGLGSQIQSGLLMWVLPQYVDLVADAFGGRVVILVADRHWWTLRDREIGRAVRLPAPVQAWLIAFNRGDMPELSYCH